MINELYKLSAAMDEAGIRTQSWHRKYKPIPNIRATAPCVRLVLAEGVITDFSEVSADLGAGLRKYGSNQGSYPCMNLAPLYRVTEEPIKKQLASLRPEKLTAEKLQELKSWCSIDNWNRKFLGKYKISMVNTSAELRAAAAEYEPLRILIEQSNLLADPAAFRQALETAVWKKLGRGEDTELALRILFYQGKANQAAEDDYGSLSVALEAEKLIDAGKPTVNRVFVAELNQTLLHVDAAEQTADETAMLDAFGTQFDPLEEPMPSVKLAGGFDVTLRTMFKEQRCQTRYGTIENASYPIAPENRKKLQAALDWLGSGERRGITWINSDKNEILFAYPGHMPKQPISFTRMFRRPEGELETPFKKQARRFLAELHETKKDGTDARAEQIQIFILRKIDKARTKIVYTRQTDARELEACSEAWTSGCMNLPPFDFGQPGVPFPLDTADILNRFWKQNGESATEKCKPVPKYHGMELLMEPAWPVEADLYLLARQEMMLGCFLGSRLAQGDRYHLIWKKVRPMLALTALLLNRVGIRKEGYMENLPYLYGQLLKTSDELHVLYCKAVRNGDVPPQLVGGSLFQAAAETPLRTLNLLSQRIMPYYTWAKSYRYKNAMEAGKESWRAGWLYGLYEKIVGQLRAVWTPQTRFNEEERAQLFIGYLAAFPQKEKAEPDLNKNEEEKEHG